MIQKNLFLLLQTDPSVAPALQAARDNLVREKLTDQLEKKIENRPTKDELVDHNIIKGMCSSVLYSVP